MTKPIAYQGRVKYDEQLARKYQSRREGKHRAEMRLVERAFRLIPKPATVLDVPCGGGRVSLFLAAEGYCVTAVDLSLPMLKIARANAAGSDLDVWVEHGDVEALAYSDHSFDAVICFRLFHHFPNKSIRSRVVHELTRVSKRFVVLSYFSPHSYTSMQRTLKAAVTGISCDRYATPLSEIKCYFVAAGFRLVRDFAQMPLLHTLHLAVFERADAKS